MLRRLTAGALVLGVAAVPACTSEDGGDSGRFPVDLLAGGGQEEPDESAVAGEDALLSGRLTSLTARPDGAIYAVLDATSLVRVDESGEVSIWSPALPDGATEIIDLAVGPGNTAYVLLRGTPAEPLSEASVYQWDGAGAIEPAFGVPEDGAEAVPATPDGATAEDAALGRVTDIAVDGAGRAVFVEEVVGAGYEVANLVRRVEDGAIRTVAGTPPAEGDELTSGVVRAAAFPEDGSQATDVPLLGPVLIGAGSDGEIVLQLTQSVLVVREDGLVERVLGAPDGTPALPRVSADGPLTDPLRPGAVEYGSNLRHANSPAMAQDGGILATTFGGLPGEAESAERHRWEVVDGSERAQAIADAAAGGEDEDLAGVYVAPDGQVVTASLFGSATTILGDGTVVVAAQDPESGESILVTFAATVTDTEG